MLRKQFDALFDKSRDKKYSSYASNMIERGFNERAVVMAGKRKTETGLVDRIHGSTLTIRFDDGEDETFAYQKVELLNESGEIVSATVKDALHRPLAVGDWVGVACHTIIEIGQVKKITPAGLVTVEVKMKGGYATKGSHTVETCRVLKLPLSDKDLMTGVMRNFEEKMP